jgi:hypothetical protein
MEAIKIKDVPSRTGEVRSAADEAVRAPVKVFRIDDVSASVFAAERQFRGGPVTFYTVSFSRSYQDKDGRRRYTKTFEADDLARVMQLAQEAGDYLDGLRRPETGR